MRTIFGYIITVSQRGTVRVEGKFPSLCLPVTMETELAGNPARQSR